MYCPECGIKLIKASKFCHRCGAKIEAPPSESLGYKETIVTKKRKTQKTSAKSIGEKKTISPEISEEKIEDLKSIGEAKTIFSQFAGVDVIGAERYEIIEPIGQGGMGIVYKAKDRKLGRIVAIKRLLKGSEGSERAIKRFRQEATAIASLNHFNIVQIYDIGEDDQGLFISMEYIEGKSLRDKLQREGALSEAEVIDIMIQLCQGLKVAHKRGIIHRDIKPSNILLTEFGIPKLADFGLARVMARTSLSLTGIVLGTIDYMSPEQQTDSAKADERSDIYSLGMTMYEMLTGEAPRVVYADKLPPRSRRIILKSAAANPKNRYQVVDEMLTDLQKLKTKEVEAEIISKITAEEEVSILCPKCGLLNPRDKMFCLKCGTSITEKCPKCGKDTGLGLTFCGQCGINIPEYKNKLKEQYTQEAKNYIVEHRFEDAFKNIAKIKELDNEHPAILKLNKLIEKEKEKISKAKDITNKADELLKSNSYDAAIINAREALKLDSFNTKTKEILSEAQDTLNEIDKLTKLFKEAFKDKRIREAELAYNKLVKILPASHSLEKEFSQFSKIIEDIGKLKAELNKLIENKDYQAALDKANGLLEQIIDDDEIIEAKGYCSEKMAKDIANKAAELLKNMNYDAALLKAKKALELGFFKTKAQEIISEAQNTLNELDNLTNVFKEAFKDKRIREAELAYNELIKILPTSHSLELEFSQFSNMLKDIDKLKAELNKIIESKHYQTALDKANGLLKIVIDDNDILEVKRHCSEKITQIKELKDVAEKEAKNENYIAALQSYKKLLDIIPEENCLKEKIEKYTPLAEVEKIANDINRCVKEKRPYKAKKLLSGPALGKIKLPYKVNNIKVALSKKLVEISVLEKECLKRSKKYDYEKARNLIEKISSNCIDSEVLKMLAYTAQATKKFKKKIKTRKIVILRRILAFISATLIISITIQIALFSSYISIFLLFAFIIIFALTLEKLDALKSQAPKEFEKYLDLLKRYINNFPK